MRPSRFISDLGALRAMLAALALLIIALAPFNGPAEVDSWRFVPTVLAPTFFAVLLFVMPLDMTMTGIFLADKRGAERARLKRALAVEIGLFAALIAVWGPILYVNLRPG